MSQLGIGVMLNQIFGSQTNCDVNKDFGGKQIASIALNDDRLFMSFTDGSSVQIFDDGQSCCEHRYMQTDDDLPAYVGRTFLRAEVRDAPNEPYEYGDHEVQFLVIVTDSGNISFANHNEHNGYYGGFSMVAVADFPAQPKEGE